MKVRLMAAAACALLVLPVAGCGNNDDDQAAASLSKSLRKDSGDLNVTKKQADCVSRKMVDKVGTEDLKKYGILTKDLKAKEDVGNVKMSASDAKGAADAFTQCVDAKALMIKAMGSSVDAKTTACMSDKLTDDAIHEFFVGLFSGDSEAAQQNLIKPMMACATGSSGQ